MTFSVWKFPLELTDHQVVRMPAGAEPLSVQVQAGQACLWARVDTSAPLADHVIRIAGTGHPMPVSSWRYVDTFQQGPFVWHVFLVCGS